MAALHGAPDVKEVEDSAESKVSDVAQHCAFTRVFLRLSSHSKRGHVRTFQ